MLSDVMGASHVIDHHRKCFLSWIQIIYIFLVVSNFNQAKEVPGMLVIIIVNVFFCGFKILFVSNFYQGMDDMNLEKFGHGHLGVIYFFDC